MRVEKTGSDNPESILAEKVGGINNRLAKYCEQLFLSDFSKPTFCPADETAYVQLGTNILL